MYLMNCIRPDIAYAVGKLSQYTQSSNQDHWTVVRRVLKYLRDTINYGLYYSGFPSVLEGFSDANWISDSDEMKSTSRSAVSWTSLVEVQLLGSLPSKLALLGLLWRLSLLP